MMNKSIRDHGVTIGFMPTGKNNNLTDVQGVKVGHHTLSEGSQQTGVTAILPHGGNHFREKLIASSHIINGFGKTTGTIQLNELGTLETPIVLTNTFGVGAAFDAIIDYTLKNNPEIGRETGTVNPVIGECNDMWLNDIRERSVQKEHITEALDNAAVDFEEGCVGAGTGMLCYSMKGGIGSASRIVELAAGDFTIGVLTLTNFGKLSDLLIDGNPIGQQLKEKILSKEDEKDRGSVMVIIATDLPVSERQLNRILKRSVTGLSRTGSIIGNGSGEVVIGFSTANEIPHEKSDTPLTLRMIHEEDMDEAFRAVGEAAEEAVLESLVKATPIIGRDGHERPTLTDLLETHNLSL
ncbi:DmpA family aminopeptidase [Halobacillus sp. H74]|uniref:DmpA family aminopeptidase n=1 Tax=Halobacillus sp. H74 TaxID=3457436 RepID=UPI003FCD9A71